MGTRRSSNTYARSKSCWCSEYIGQVCVCMYIYICIYVHTYAYVYVCVDGSVYVCCGFYLCPELIEQGYVCVHTHVHRCTYLCICVCLCRRVYVCVLWLIFTPGTHRASLCVYVHTYIHMPVHLWTGLCMCAVAAMGWLRLVGSSKL